MKLGKVAGVTLAGACLAWGVAVADQPDDAPVAMPQDVVAAATAFEGYMNATSRIDSEFSNGAAVHRSLQQAAAYEPVQLEEGMIAYGAIAALQDDHFVAAVRAAAGRGDQRAQFAEQMIEDPYAATRIDGAGGAVRLIDEALTAKAAPLVTAGTQVKTAAYTVQHQAWSKVTVSDATSRLAEVKSLSRVRAAPTSDDDQAMVTRVQGQGDDSDDDTAPSAYSAIEARALALAAEAVIGRASGPDRDRISPLLSEADSAECFRMSKLNLYQCMAVAGPQYEDIYCMGQHAMMDTGQCVSHATHPVTSAETALAILSSRPMESKAVSLPMVSHISLRIDPN